MGAFVLMVSLNGLESKNKKEIFFISHFFIGHQ